jgi:hypothetical protein
MWALAKESGGVSSVCRHDLLDGHRLQTSGGKLDLGLTHGLKQFIAATFRRWSAEDGDRLSLFFHRQFGN